MAIIVDPDNLDRRQVIFGSANQELSIRDVGNVVSSAFLDKDGGIATSGTLWFTGSAGSDFVTNGAVAGSALCIFEGIDAGHWIIDTVDTETTLTLNSTNHTGSFVGSTVAVYDIRSGSGGGVVDGITEQAVYSFAKEEWKTDSEVFNSDDLIRHPFPFEAITREQMELGGGVAHDDWTYNSRDNQFTIKKIRTGGWANVDGASSTNENYSGIITLGNIDSDAQVYFQQVNTGSAPTDFTFLGGVNEAILTSGSLDFRTYLKLFVRKKYRSYAQSEIADIGVSSLETIVNRFPLTHTTDPAIVLTEGEIIGNTPIHNQNILSSNTDGSKISGSLTFESLGSTFVTDGVQAGDTLDITTGGDTDYYTIAETPLIETSVTCSADVDFTGFTVTEGTLTFDITTTDIVRQIVDDGAIQDVDTSTGTITSSVGGFTAAGIAAGDILIISENSFSGAYKVISNDSDTQLTVNTSDQPFPGTEQSAIDYKIVEPGMYLQYKKDNVELVNGGDFTFEGGSPPAITRSLGSWSSDGVTTGTVIEVAGSTNNNGSFTVASVESATLLTLVSTDATVDEGPVTVTSSAYDAFKRTVAGETYAFKWRLFGNDSTLANQFQYVQNQLRQATDIDFGNQVNRGDISDLLMTFATPTATTLDLYIDDLDATDTNNVTWTDATGVTRVENFVSAGSIAFNSNLQNDSGAIYVMFFTNDDAGDNTGRDYGTSNAIVVKDSSNNDISGSVAAASSVSFDFDYDNNAQRGAGSVATDAPVTIVAIGLNTAQFVLAQGTIDRSKANNFSLVSALERNYSNPN